MKHRVLWIEDGALADLAELAGPVYRDGKYDLVIALSASEGVAEVLSSEFDALIVDIRLPPGDSEEWVSLFREAGERKAEARLGLELLFTLLQSSDAKVKIDKAPGWLTPAKIAIFSVESFHEVEDQVNRMGVSAFAEKTAQISRRILLDLIRKIINSSDLQV